MLSDHKQAEAYALVTDALDELNVWLDSIESALLKEDWPAVHRVGDKLATAKEILDV